MIGRFLFVYIVYGLVAHENAQIHSGATSQTVEKIRADGFPAETHSVTTSDGYILEMHRIPHGREAVDSDVKRPVVFLMHGLMGASNQYIMLGANNSFAYNLADEGFDVWMGNARGNSYSRKHITLDPDHNTQRLQFFDFTFEEIGIHDLPAMIDYALNYTESSQLHYIGHSQGGTVFLVLTSLMPQYNSKIASAHLLAGVGYQAYFPNEMLSELAVDVDSIYALATAMGIVELYPDLFLSQSRTNGFRMSDYCTGNLEQKHMCDLFGIGQILRNSSSAAQEFTPSGASLKQVAHYGQNIRDKLFRRYHFGTESNQVQYGLAEPPPYNLSLISCKVTMHYSMNDTLLDEKDVLTMVEDMPNAIARRVARESFDHSDYVTALDAKELVTDFIINDIKNTLIDGAPGSASKTFLTTYLSLCSLIMIFISSTKVFCF
ncbi:unnamed protein product [Arctia plantaginis]|uniref:Lipase n=1 Tax=Arctia plantaginis TaxID=874455 RepID=A0A8S1A0I7_ARCPL|nr:unnamed protein product [Arctia plantaginis]